MEIVNGSTSIVKIEPTSTPLSVQEAEQVAMRSSSIKMVTVASAELQVVQLPRPSALTHSVFALSVNQK